MVSLCSIKCQEKNGGSCRTKHLPELFVLPGVLHELPRMSSQPACDGNSPGSVCRGKRREDGAWKTVVDKISGWWELCFVERPVCA